MLLNAAATQSGYAGAENLFFSLVSLGGPVLRELSTEGARLASLHWACLGARRTRASFQELPPRQGSSCRAQAAPRDPRQAVQSTAGSQQDAQGHSLASVY